MAEAQSAQADLLPFQRRVSNPSDSPVRGVVKFYLT
jgi:hypothetical protein